MQNNFKKQLLLQNVQMDGAINVWKRQLNEEDALARKREEEWKERKKGRKATETWVEEKRVEAAKDIDHVKDTYRKRAAVIGFRCGVIFHLLSGKDKESYSETCR